MKYTEPMEVFEVLDLFTEAKSRKDKIEVLKKYGQNMPVRDVLQGTFDPSIEWNLPDGTPPYTPNNEDTAPSSLRRQHLDFKYFVKGLLESNRLNPIKRERMFIDMLESVHPEDAKILVSMINKKAPVKGLTKKIVQEVYPNLIPN